MVFVHYNGTAVSHGFDIPGLRHASVSGIGVDMFFVISGFIMELTAGGEVRPVAGAKEFLSRRAMRLLPLYWSLTAIAYATALAFGESVHTTVNLRQFLLSLVLLPSTRPDGQAFYVISVAWTLTYEVYFYLLFAMLLRVEAVTRVATLAAIFAASVIIGGVAQPVAPLARDVVDPILLEFVAGCLLAILVRRGHGLGRPAASLAAVVAIAWMLLEFDVVVPGALRVVLWGGPAWLLVAAVVLAKNVSSSRLEALLTYLGDISYSLYLSHFFAVALFVRMQSRWSDSLLSSEWVCLFVFCGLCLLLAHVCFITIERPARRLMQLVRRHRAGFAV